MRDHGVAMGRLPARLEREEAARRAWTAVPPPPALRPAATVVRTAPDFSLSVPVERGAPAQPATSPVPPPATPEARAHRAGDAPRLTCPTCGSPKSTAARPGPCRACWRAGAVERKAARKERVRKKSGRLSQGSPEHRAAVGAKIRALWAAKTPEERTAIGKRAATTRLATQPIEVRREAMKKRRAAQTPEQHRALASAGAAGLHSRPWEVRSARAKKAAACESAKNVEAKERRAAAFREQWQRLTPAEKSARAKKAAETRRRKESKP